jgi:dinuclear metal center YbgI/SA1388 family protein
MAKRDKIIDFINRTLRVEPDKDPYLLNGLQVIGKDEVKKVALGVSPNLELFQKAADWGADMIILHHGLLGPKTSAPITKVLKKRLKILFDNDVTLLTYHLFLDNHPTLGNNAQIIKLLDAKKGEKFGYLDKLYWGYVGQFTKAIAVEELIKRARKLCGSGVKIFKYGPKMIKRIGVVSGGGPYLLGEAVDRSLDAFLTGEPRESTEAWAKEAGVHFIYLGHYNSEKFGIQALGEVLKKKFPQVIFKFIDIPNPL